MTHVVTRGLVLREVSYKETDKLLTVLLAGQGKRTVKARGCRSRKSAIAAAAQLLVWSEMTLFEYRDMWTLRQADTLDVFRGVRDDLEKLALGSYFAQTVETVSEEGVETPGVLELILNSLYALDRLARPLWLVKGAFELKLACLAGYEPALDACPVCGAAQPEQPRLNLREGVVHCAGCGRFLEDAKASVPLDAPSLAAMRYVVHGPRRRLFSFTLPPESGRRFGGACERFLLAQMDREFRTLDFYKTVSRQPHPAGG